MSNPPTSAPINAGRMTPDEIQQWEQDGYFVRRGVFSSAENDQLRQAPAVTLRLDFQGIRRW